MTTDTLILLAALALVALLLVLLLLLRRPRVELPPEWLERLAAPFGVGLP